MLLGAALLAGCASEPRAPLPAHPHRVWLAHWAKMGGITHFTLSAEGGIRSGGHGGTLMLHWVVRPRAYQMTGYGPFGRLVFRLRANGDGAKLLTERGHFRGPDADALLARLTGWRLPVAGLRYWILGIPDPGPITSQHVNRFGLLAALGQAGWSIRYRQYRETPWGRLPELLSLTRSEKTGPPARITVTLRINQWQAGS